MAIVFWLLSFLVVWVYAGYPLFLMATRAVLGRRAIATGPIEPSVTLIISAYNEQEVIGEKIANSLSLDYPPDKLQVIVVSDASSDRTDEIVGGVNDSRVSLLRMADRSGKTAGLNAAVAAARGEIVVFSDANAMYYPQVLRLLARNFADPAVGAAVGESTYVGQEAESEQSEGLYWRYEVAIKRLESDIGSVVGGDGAIYAIRRALYVPMPADAISDFTNPLQIVMNGYRCIYDSEARSYERAASDFQKEFRRKVRIVNRAWRATFRVPALMNPLRHGMFAIELISHKLLRWLVPAFLVGILVSNLSLVGESGIYALALLAQFGFYGFALSGYLLRDSPHLPAFLSVPFFFCLVNIASAMGILDAFRGKTYTTWAPPRTQS